MSVAIMAAIVAVAWWLGRGLFRTVKERRLARLESAARARRDYEMARACARARMTTSREGRAWLRAQGIAAPQVDWWSGSLAEWVGDLVWLGGLILLFLVIIWLSREA